ncbi:hydroxymethylglutaryl-CoA lyase [Pseudolysinimonas yzui]|uniref:Hydroxymethylglutaryl-CoA lyase n=1 Tax=Pseudolysinimonas yzui TaxID=2708254 RepID=A0A8J3M2M2_9MICO|nr:hydroxymethylglutaryl-CoA lyase [Pseudolysinimonas yzui]GHF24226.1 hydroxymethylglutaryl-CoA lyase [Pseudolysinimonas yzui]
MHVEVVEVSPRDGLQNESVILSTAAKVDLVSRLVAAGATRIEAVSFAHPRLVPAMADAEEVMAGVPRQAGVSYAGLVLNRRGLDRALATGVDEVNVVVCASDTFSQRNQNASTDESLAAAIDVVRDARAAGLFTTVSIATAFGCPFEGEVAAERVLDLARRSADAGADEICFADTIGVGVPTQVRSLADGFRSTHETALRFHFHNTRNTGYANAAAAIDAGVMTLDASAGGIGGCPFAPRATGNIATEDLIYLVERMGMSTGWNLLAVLPIADFLSAELGKTVPSMLSQAGSFPPSA